MLAATCTTQCVCSEQTAAGNAANFDAPPRAGHEHRDCCVTNAPMLSQESRVPCDLEARWRKVGISEEGKGQRAGAGEQWRDSEGSARTYSNCDARIQTHGLGTVLAGLGIRDVAVDARSLPVAVV